MQRRSADILGEGVMKTKYIDVDGKWGIVIIYDFSKIDEEEMAGVMDSFGMDMPGIRRSLRILSSYNTGMAISRDDIRMSAIFISHATNAEQWWDTCTHELLHAWNAICDYYDVPMDSEDAAWTMGYLMRKTVECIAPPCI